MLNTLRLHREMLPHKNSPPRQSESLALMEEPWEHLAFKVSMGWVQELHRTGGNRDSTLGGHKGFKYTGTQHKAVHAQEPGLLLPMGLGGCPEEAKFNYSSLWWQGHWKCKSQAILIRVSSPRDPHFGTKTQPYPTTCSLQCWKDSDQTATKIATQPHPAEDRLPKGVHNSQTTKNTPFDVALPIRGTRPSSTKQRAGTSPSHQEPCTSTWSKLTHQRADARSKRNCNPVACGKETTNTVKRQNEMTKNMLQKKDQDKNPQEQINEEKIVNLLEKLFRVMIINSDLKKCTTWELWVKFYLRQNEDYSLRDSISDNSEKLLERGRGEGQHICDFSGDGVHATKHIFFAEGLMRVSASHEEQTSPWRNLMLF